ncbi:MFS transporter [Paraferrimonas sedimenticola]|uniref:Tetracycline resistance MFS efflux pump n=1 Tax=Paraferrimonas sedimenticola TaxID=375674 RepID=A0AA37RW23_9GAMM|nr:MFS transporter [Paraferrimonas sedimenticola]GLP96364.1 tetracycline resistance MFS efflux pump [Paraferrimonas sedimenticola]
MPLLFAVVLIELIGFGIVIPILPFLAPSLGASNFDIALIIAVFSVFSGLCGGYWGALSDKVGRKPVMAACLFLTAISYLVLAFAETLTMVYVARIMAGCSAGVYGVASAMVADLSDEKNRTKSMGLIGAAFGLGMVVGPFLGGVLAGEALNFTLPSLVAAALSAIAAVLCLVILPESLSKRDRAENRAQRKHRRTLYQLLKEIQCRWLVSLYLLHSMVISITGYLFPLWTGYNLGWGPKEIGYVFGVQGLAMAALQGRLVGILAARFGEVQMMIVGLVLLISGYAIATQSSDLPWVLVAFFGIITGATICTPVMNSLLSQRTPLSNRGRVMGSSMAIGAWGRVAGPLSAGVVLTQFGYEAAWGIGIVMGLVFIVWPIVELGRAPQQEQATAPES